MNLLNLTPEKLSQSVNTEITLNAYVLRIRKASSLYFVTLRYGKYCFQSIYIPDLCKTPLRGIGEGAYIEAVASVKEEKRAPYGFELTLKSFRTLSQPTDEYPLNVSQPTLGSTLEDKIKNRSVSIKHPSEFAIISIHGDVEFAFSQFMQMNDFVKVHSPKINKACSVTDYINAQYFQHKASLAHSPVLHLIPAVGGLDRVYETGVGYSSKNRNSLRHTNEFTRLDFELSYANRETVIEILKDAIGYILCYIEKNCKSELEILGVKLNKPASIPVISHNTAMDIIEKPCTQKSLDPTDEKKLCLYAKSEYESNYIFITDMPKENRPFCEKDGCGFVLLSNGLEIASGGEHISDYTKQHKKISDFGLSPDDYESFLFAHKYGLPPLAGAGIGLERFVMALLGLDNIRRATLFTRDLHHLVP